MVFIETPIFTRQIKALITDEAYHVFQKLLAENPEAGDVIPGTGGLRKIRMALPGGGKSGGARVIYYHLRDAARSCCCWPTGNPNKPISRSSSAGRSGRSSRPGSSHGQQAV